MAIAAWHRHNSSAGGVVILILDYPAEATMSMLGAMRCKRDILGYASDFTEWVWKHNSRELRRTGLGSSPMPAA